MQRRDQQPRWFPQGDHSDPDGAGYFAYEAVLLVLANSISDNTALDRAEAKQLVEKYNSTPQLWLLDAERPPYVAGVVRFMNSYELACGSYEQILKGLDDLRENWKDEFKWCTVFDFTDELQSILDRAAFGGIKLLRDA